jgi:hypothetical protein
MFLSFSRDGIVNITRKESEILTFLVALLTRKKRSLNQPFEDLYRFLFNILQVVKAKLYLDCFFTFAVSYSLNVWSYIN